MTVSTLSALGRRVGASPGEVALLLVCLAFAAYAGFFLLGDPSLLRMLIWFAGAAVVHDLVLFPAYSAADRALVAAARGRVGLINHIRVPAMGAGLTLLMFWPGIVRQGEGTHLAATGLDQSPYLGRWLGLTAVLFGLSGLVYVGRVGAARLRRWRGAERAEPAQGVAAAQTPTAGAPAQAEQNSAGRAPAGQTSAGRAAEGVAAQAEHTSAAEAEPLGRDRGAGDGSANAAGRP